MVDTADGAITTEFSRLMMLLCGFVLPQLLAIERAPAQEISGSQVAGKVSSALKSFTQIALLSEFSSLILKRCALD